MRTLLCKTAFGIRPFGQGKQPRSLTLTARNSVGRPVNSHFDNSLKHLPPTVGFRPVLDRIVTTTETSPEADRGRAQNEGVTLSRTANSRLSWTVVSQNVYFLSNWVFLFLFSLYDPSTLQSGTIVKQWLLSRLDHHRQVGASIGVIGTVGCPELIAICCTRRWRPARPAIVPVPHRRSRQG